MRCFSALILIAVISAAAWAASPNITIGVPEKIDRSKKYLFYLHGGIVSQMGARNSVSEYYGKYEYCQILDALAAKGFHVISEVRPKNTKEEVYAAKLAGQISRLRKARVPEKNIYVVGASLGAYIAIETAYRIRRKKVRFALLGLCSPYAIKYFQKYRKKLRGDFISIFENSDAKKSCRRIFEPRGKATFREIRLTLGNSHGFLYRPYNEWIGPITDWR